MSIYDAIEAAKEAAKAAANAAIAAQGLAIQQQYNSLTSDIAGVKTKITDNTDYIDNELKSQINGAIAAAKEASKSAGDAATTALQLTIDKAKDSITSNIEIDYDALNKAIDAAKEATGRQYGSITDDIKSAIEAAKGASAATKSAQEVLQDFIKSTVDTAKGSILDDLKTRFGDAWTSISGGFSDASAWVTSSVGGLWDSLTGLAGDLLSGVTGALGKGLQDFIDWVLTKLRYIGEQIIGGLTGFVEGIKDVFMQFINYCINGITGALSRGSPPKEISEPVNVMTQSLWDRQIKTIDRIYKSEPTELATTSAAMETLEVLIGGAIFALSTGTIADIIHPLKDLGIKVNAREIIYWLGIPSVTAAIAVMPTQLGLLLPLQYYLNYKWTPRIPDANDLVRFAVRECFIPAELERLLEPGPGEKYYSYMKMQGYSGEWANRFWGAHWVRPTIENLNNALYRGIILPEEWEHEVKLNDYAPYAVKWLQKIIYNPYTRVDIRRMWDIGLVTEAEMLENYRWLGYDDKHAERMTLWSKAYTVAADIRALYSKGWIDESGARQMIETAGVPKERADVFLQKLVKSGQADRVATEKDLTKTDILRLFKLGLISQPQAASMLTDLGYDAEEASYLTALYQGSQEITLKELTQAQILKAYRFGIYNRDEAKNKLVEEGWSSDAAETLLRLEDVNKAEATVTKQYERDLSRSDIINAIHREIIDKPTGHDYLAYMGYSEWEIDLIFALEEIA